MILGIIFTIVVLIYVVWYVVDSHVEIRSNAKPQTPEEAAKDYWISSFSGIIPKTREELEEQLLNLHINPCGFDTTQVSILCHEDRCTKKDCPHFRDNFEYLCKLFNL